MKIVIGVISAIISTVVIMITGILGYKWYRNRQHKGQDEIIRISGNYGNSNLSNLII